MASASLSDDVCVTDFVPRVSLVDIVVTLVLDYRDGNKSCKVYSSSSLVSKKNRYFNSPSCSKTRTAALALRLDIRAFSAKVEIAGNAIPSSLV